MSRPNSYGPGTFGKEGTFGIDSITFVLLSTGSLTGLDGGDLQVLLNISSIISLSLIILFIKDT